jgi:hypothetical protein
MQYHSNAVVFAAANSCLTLHWESPSRLDAIGSGPYPDQDHIDVLKGERGGKYLLTSILPTYRVSTVAVPCLKEYAAQGHTANASGLAGLPLARK